MAGLQRQVLSAVSVLVKEGACEQAVEDEIRYRLLDLSELYNDVCGPYCLWEECLSILLVAGMADNDNIELLWRALICDGLADDCENEAVLAHLLNMREGVPERGGAANKGMFENGEWIGVVRSKAVSVGRALWGRGGDYTVPVRMLIFELEGLRRCWSAIGAEGGEWAGNWVVQSMCDIGVGWQELLDGYVGVLSDRESKGADKLERLHYIKGVCEVMMRWARGEGRGGMTRLRGVLDSVRANVESLVVVGSGGGGEVGGVLRMLDDLEAVIGEGGGGGKAGKVVLR